LIGYDDHFDEVQYQFAPLLSIEFPKCVRDFAIARNVMNFFEEFSHFFQVDGPTVQSGIDIVCRQGTQLFIVKIDLLSRWPSFFSLCRIDF